MEQYVGAEFVLTAKETGLVITRNEEGHGCGEIFAWNEIKSLFDRSDNSDCAKGNQNADK